MKKLEQMSEEYASPEREAERWAFEAGFLAAREMAVALHSDDEGCSVLCKLEVLGEEEVKT